MIDCNCASFYFLRERMEKVFDLKSATKPFNLLLACTCPLVTEFADN